MNKHTYNLKKGFTLVEIMVSVAIFTIIITTGIGALVSIVNSYEVTQNQKKVHDALNYALESMTREIRLGKDYFAGAVPDGSSAGAFQDGQGSSLGFSAVNRNVNASNAYIYTVYFVDAGGSLNVYRNGVAQMLTDTNELSIEDIEFRVIGTASSTEGDNRQPLVWVRIKASAQGSERTTVVQSLISQRTLDI